MADSTRRTVTGLITPSRVSTSTRDAAASATVLAARETATSAAPPPNPIIARRRTAASSPEGELTHELEHQIGGEQRGDLSGAIVGGRHLDDVRSYQAEPVEPAHQPERLVGREPAHLGRPGGGSVGGIHRVDV